MALYFICNIYYGNGKDRHVDFGLRYNGSIVRFPAQGLFMVPVCMYVMRAPRDWIVNKQDTADNISMWGAGLCDTRYCITRNQMLYLQNQI